MLVIKYSLSLLGHEFDSQRGSGSMGPKIGVLLHYRRLQDLERGRTALGTNGYSFVNYYSKLNLQI